MTLGAWMLGRKRARFLPLVYACEILTELRQRPPPKETFIIGKAREGC